jgi:hypothetical protein
MRVHTAREILLMNFDAMGRLAFMGTQILRAEKAFMGSGFVHTLHVELDRLQISWSSHPAVLESIKAMRSCMGDFITTKINMRLVGEQAPSCSAQLWSAFCDLEQAILQAQGVHQLPVAARGSVKLAIVAA